MDECQNIQKLAAEREEFKRHVVALDAALKKVESEVKTLRNSRIWRITAPLRAVNAWLAEVMRLPTRRFL